jgi:hypothetical protein
MFKNRTAMKLSVYRLAWFAWTNMPQQLDNPFAEGTEENQRFQFAISQFDAAKNFLESDDYE